MALFCELHGTAPDAHEAHRRLLERIGGERLLAVRAEEGGRAIACGLGVRDGEMVGLFDLITAPTHRNRGHGRALLEAMLGWAAGRGARTAYLQVTESNGAARHLYASLGFRELYRYSYRVQGGP